MGYIVMLYVMKYDVMGYIIMLYLIKYDFMGGIHCNTLCLFHTKNECNELEKKLFLSDHQLDQVKEELSLREAQILKQQLLTARVEKEKESLRVMIYLLSTGRLLEILRVMTYL